MSGATSTILPSIKNVTTTLRPVVDDSNLCQGRDFAAKTNNFMECFLFKLPYFLQDIGMGYICIALCTVVIVTSMFGKIKESYKWFIFNQAIWDLLVSYDYICSRPSATEWMRGGDNVWTEILDVVEPTCFYSSSTRLTRFINNIINKEACYMLFLLSFSRFLALYFHHFYERNFGTTLKAAAAILVFDLFFVFSVNIRNTYLAFITWGNSISTSLSVPEYVIMLLIIPASLIFTICVLVKIFRQLKFQAQQQSNTQRSANIRIAGVLVFQCITLIIFFAFTSVYDFPMDIIPSFNFVILKLPLNVNIPSPLIRGFKNNQKCINVIRVFIDSIVVLVVLSGYRRSILNIFQKMFLRWKISPVESSTRDTAATIRNTIASGNRR